MWRGGNLVIGLQLCACTMMGHERVQGWPELQIVEHHVPEHAMRDQCVRYTALGMSPLACAQIDFAHRICHLWFSIDFPPPGSFVQHERLHCAGHDHIGQATLQNLWTRYVRSMQQAAAEAGED